MIGGDDNLPPAAEPKVWAGQPGTRVPHVWIERGGRRISTIDLFTRQLSVVSRDQRWLAAAWRVSDATGVPVDAVQIGTDVTFPGDADFEATFGVSEDGACLVRPDAIIAWRSSAMKASPDGVLHRVVTAIAGRAADRIKARAKDGTAPSAGDPVA